MNNLKTTDLGGFPLRSDDFRWSYQAMKDAFKGIMSSYGISNSTAVVLSGCTRSVASGTVTIAAGYISIGGEVCYVPAHSYPAPVGTQKEYWVIDISYDNTGLKTFQDASTHDTYEVRTGKIAVASTVPSGFTSYNQTKTIFEVINTKVDSVPLGAILMWSGTIANIPIGYALCNGSNGTPDLRGRFVVGVDTRSTQPAGSPQWDANYNGIGNVGGSKGVTLTVQNIPPHTHEVVVDNTDGGEFGTLIIPDSFIGTSDTDPGLRTSTGGAVNPTWSTAPHENRPPYYVIAFIMKVTPSTPPITEIPEGLPGETG